MISGDSWPQLKAMFERAEKWCIHAGPGHWPDLDMLPAGAIRQVQSPEEWTHFTQAELRTMMTLWCIMPAPLMFGGELTKLDAFTLNLITNRDVLDMAKAIHCAHPLYTREDAVAWMAPRRDGHGCYLALFNLTDEACVLVPAPGRGWTGTRRSSGTLDRGNNPRRCGARENRSPRGGAMAGTVNHGKKLSLWNDLTARKSCLSVRIALDRLSFAAYNNSRERCSWGVRQCSGFPHIS